MFWAGKPRWSKNMFYYYSRESWCSLVVFHIPSPNSVGVKSILPTHCRMNQRKRSNPIWRKILGEGDKTYWESRRLKAVENAVVPPSEMQVPGQGSKRLASFVGEGRPTKVRWREPSTPKAISFSTSQAISTTCKKFQNTGARRANYQWVQYHSILAPGPEDILQDSRDLGGMQCGPVCYTAHWSSLSVGGRTRM